MAELVLQHTIASGQILALYHGDLTGERADVAGFRHELEQRGL
jgi:hypothetical protein